MSIYFQISLANFLYFGHRIFVDVEKMRKPYIKVLAVVAAESFQFVKNNKAECMCYQD